MNEIILVENLVYPTPNTGIKQYKTIKKIFLK